VIVSGSRQIILAVASLLELLELLVLLELLTSLRRVNPPVSVRGQEIAFSEDLP
jgi:hypothetical protein